jgi:hypothetical protein
VRKIEFRKQNINLGNLGLGIAVRLRADYLSASGWAMAMARRGSLARGAVAAGQWAALQCWC